MGKETLWAGSRPEKKEPPMFLGVNLVHDDITKEEIDEMLRFIKPVVRVSSDDYHSCYKCKKNHKFFEIDLTGVDYFGRAYLWDPKLGREVNLASSNGMACSFPVYSSANVFVKFSVAEVYGAIKKLVPDWKYARYAWLSDDYCRVHEFSSGSFHRNDCHLFITEFGPPNESGWSTGLPWKEIV